MKLSDYVIQFLVKERIDHVFEVCGGAISHLLDSMYGRKDIMCVSMHHEQAAAFAAEAYGRLSGKFGVAMATSGPGATNLITGIASAYFDSVPAVFITGQVNTYEYKFNSPVRQIGFQETDIVSIVKPIVKEAHLIKDPASIRYYLERAVYIARQHRQGPVLLDIPMNIQRAAIEPRLLKPFVPRYIDRGLSAKSVLSDAVRMLKESRRPVIIAGGGVRSSGASDELLRFVSKTKIPVVCSLMGVDAFTHERPEFTGMIGTYGSRAANLTVANSDLVLALGTRLDTRQTGTRPDSFARGAKIIRVDIDANEIKGKIKPHIGIRCDIKEFFSAINDRLGSYDRKLTLSWRDRVGGYKRSYPFDVNGSGLFINPNAFMNTLSDIMPDNAVICTDIGQNQMWAAQSVKLKRNQRFITQGGMASMGSVLSLAIGASFARPGVPVVAITGDGGFQANIQELETIRFHNLPIKIVLLNNEGYGMIRQFQKQYFNSRFQSTGIGYSHPDFQKVAASYGIAAMKVSRKSQIRHAIKRLFAGSRPAFLEVRIDKDAVVSPKLAVDKPIEDQEPLLPRHELRSKMIVKLLPENKA